MVLYIFVMFGVVYVWVSYCMDVYYVIMWGGYGGYCYGVVVLNLFIMVLCGFVYFSNVWGCVCVGFVLYGCVRLM